jgi:hypothetical protein
MSLVISQEVVKASGLSEDELFQEIVMMGSSELIM